MLPIEMVMMGPKHLPIVSQHVVLVVKHSLITNAFDWFTPATNTNNSTSTFFTPTTAHLLSLHSLHYAYRLNTTTNTN